MARGDYWEHSFRSDAERHDDRWKQRGNGRVLLASQEPRRARGNGPDPRACPGPCNETYRKAWDAYRAAVAAYDPLDSAQSRPAEPEEGGYLGDPVWCGPCAGKITLRLAELDDLAGILTAAADGHRDASGLERVASSADPGSPSPAADALDEMHSMLSGWETAWRELNGWLSPPPRGTLATRETACVNWLRRHLAAILASETIGADFGLEILQWHREAAGSAKAGVRTLRKPMRCPSCRLLTLFWTEGDATVNCKNPDCGRILDLAAYDDEVDRQSAALQRGELDEDATGNA